MPQSRRSSIASIGSVGGASSSGRRSSVPSLNLWQLPPHQQPQFHSQRQRRGSLQGRKQQKPQAHQQDGLKSINESDKPTLELAAYASEEFLDAMRQTAAPRFTVVASRQQPPHLRRLSEPAVMALNGGPTPRSERRHSVHALIDGPPTAFLSKKTQFGSGDSGQLCSFAELDEVDEGETEEQRSQREEAVLTSSRTLLSELHRPQSRATVDSVQNQRRVSIDSAVWVN